MNALFPMEDVNTIVPIQLAATIAHVLLVVLLMMTMITVANVRYIKQFILYFAWADQRGKVCFIFHKVQRCCMVKKHS